MDNLYNSFAKVALANREKAAIIEGERSYSYAEVHMTVEALASVVAASTQNPVCGIYLPNSAAFIMGSYAIFRSGKAALPFNLLAPMPELEHIVRDSGIDTVITSERLVERLGALPLSKILVEDLQRKAAEGVAPPLEALAGIEPPTRDDLALLLYTSGTTGVPKGVELTHGNILSNIEGCLSLFKLGPGHVLIGILPMFHSFASTGVMGIGMHSGSTIVPQPRFIPDDVLSAIEKYKVTLILAVPSMYRVLMQAQRLRPRDVSSLRYAIAGGEPVPQALTDGFKQIFGVDLIQGYGLTETSPVVSANPPDANRPGTAGLPLPGISVRTVNDQGFDVPLGEVGELIVKGPCVMRGYRNAPVATAEMIRDGWLHTGDLASIDDAGYVSIRGRQKDLIITGGMNVYPPEIEAALEEHPAVKLAAVIGIPDPRHGQVARAIIVPRDERVLAGDGAAAEEGTEPAVTVDALEDTLKDYLKGRLAPHKVPKQFEFRSEVPLGPTGKIFKRALIAELGL